ncbi:DUF2878 domain-containing protein [Marinomonas sp. A79]|uniref:DUF2878 domain-containing protein n=1 Tax=Marinomonas vulgaris TaxID=2823372 RepID=A0ABS5HBS7_9GAMM|nr:DUF2878 domain-containing protein [Marinomonas vulgaris]MBR7888877.1 DUF2878 domain-containing protein [Marinomonas vulgaris]
MKPAINAILFQLVWFVCLLFGSAWALAATAVYLFLHHHYFMRSRREWRLLLTFLFLGLVVDGILFQIGVFSFVDPNIQTVAFPPVWLLCLWVCVGSLFAHSLSFLRSRYVLAALMGTLGPTMSYFAGAKLAGIALAQPMFISLLIVAVIWAFVLPVGVWLSDKWALFQD